MAVQQLNYEFTRFSPFTEVLKEGVAMCVAGASVREICAKCDERVEEETAKVKYQDREVDSCRSACISRLISLSGVQEGQEGAEGHRVPVLRLGQQLHLPLLANEQ